MADGYESAFYEIAAILGISAQARSPKEVFEQQMKPRLRALLSDDGIAAARPLGIGQRDEGGCRDA